MLGGFSWSESKCSADWMVGGESLEVSLYVLQVPGHLALEKSVVCRRARYVYDASRMLLANGWMQMQGEIENVVGILGWKTCCSRRILLPHVRARLD